MTRTLRIVTHEGQPTATDPCTMPALVAAMHDVSDAMRRVTSQAESDALVARSEVILFAVAAVLASEGGAR